MNLTSIYNAAFDTPLKKVFFGILGLAVLSTPFFISSKWIEPFVYTGVEDKVFHFLFFATLAFTFSKDKRIWVLGCLFLFGLGIEGLQSFLPDRGASLSDALSNGVGIALGGSLKFWKLKKADNLIQEPAAV